MLRNTKIPKTDQQFSIALTNFPFSIFNYYFIRGYVRINSANPLISFAGMAELADALDSGSSEVTFVQVQVLLPAPTHKGSEMLPLCVGAGNRIT